VRIGLPMAYCFLYMQATNMIPLSTKFSKFSNMMVAIDGSEHSIKAAEYALDIAKTFDATLHAVTVTYIPESYHVRQEDVLQQPKQMSDKMDNAKSWFESFNENAREKNVQIRTELINSQRPVDYVLLEYAEKENINLIVVGTRGRSGFRKLLLGSIASAIVTYAHCPVLVVK
jgi:nucleotide-binding universal stress UspA family protein